MPLLRKEINYSMKSIYRDDFQVMGYHFGSGHQTACIIGGLRGNEVQQMYICSQMIKVLGELEAAGCIRKNREILVIPAVNHYGTNIGERFWGVDGTDINRMFPGYDRGETTQRIAAGVFDVVKNYTYGIQLASYYMKGEFIPHVRILATGYQNENMAMQFGTEYVALRTPTPFDTTTLNYNWQIWNCEAFSLFTEETQKIHPEGARDGVNAILRFLRSRGVLNVDVPAGCAHPVLLRDEDMTTVRSEAGGIYERRKGQGDSVYKGELMGRIVHPYEGTVLDDVLSPVDGRVFFAHRSQMAMEHEVLFRMITK
ncbi:MAG: M14 family metallopeptidase [Lachnospiraceae bacterium]|nr:M14 family metallopeptidase [Lachnospiraceae bacterium]